MASSSNTVGLAVGSLEVLTARGPAGTRWSTAERMSAARNRFPCGTGALITTQPVPPIMESFREDPHCRCRCPRGRLRPGRPRPVPGVRRTPGSALHEEEHRLPRRTGPAGGRRGQQEDAEAKVTAAEKALDRARADRETLNKTARIGVQLVNVLEGGDAPLNGEGKQAARDLSAAADRHNGHR